MTHSTAFIGLDTHKRTIAIAIADAGRDGEVRYFGQIANETTAVNKLVKKLAGKYASLSFCYEAGACGYKLQRQIAGLGHECIVIAPSLTPSKPGDRIKNDQRDALSLARLHRAGELTSVWVPNAAHEAIRDLVRARISAMEAVRKFRQQLQGILLRHGRSYPGKTAWTKSHILWIRQLAFDQPAHYIVIEEQLGAIRDSQERLTRLEQQIINLLPGWSLESVARGVQAMRGVSLISAVILVSEIGDFNRFAHPRQLVSYLGLCPSEHSSGERVIRGEITKAGSDRARRVLIEGAWAYAKPARVSKKIAARLEDLPPIVQEIAWKGQLRMCQRYRAMLKRGKHKNVIITAIAREMVGFLWAIARAVMPPASVAHDS